jgi:hypothetical protein
LRHAPRLGGVGANMTSFLPNNATVNDGGFAL